MQRKSKHLMILTTIIAILAIATIGFALDDSEGIRSDAAPVSETWHGIVWGTQYFTILVGDSVTISPTGPGTQNMPTSVESYPSGSNYNSSTGVFTWTPSTAGTFSLKFTWTDPDYGAATVTVTFVVQAQQNNFTLKYNAQGGSPTPPDQTATSTSTTYSFTIPSQYRQGGSSAPTKTGYTFIGWNTTPSATTGIGSPYNVSVNIGTSYLYAIYTEDPTFTFTVTYDLNGGTSPYYTDPIGFTSPTYTKGYEIPAASLKPTHSHYAFSHWEVSSRTSLLNNWTVVGTADPGDTITMTTGGPTFPQVWYQLRAIWFSGIQTLTFDSNGGSGLIDNMDVISGTKIMLPVVGFSRAGYYQSGWRQGSVTGTHYDLAAMYTVAGATTFYAEWTELPANNIAQAPTTGTVGVLYTFEVSKDIPPFGAFYSALPGGPLNPVGYVVIDSAPMWMSVTRMTDKVSFSGVPNAAGLYTVQMHVGGIPTDYQSYTYIFWTIAVDDPSITQPKTVSFDVNGGTGSVSSFTVQNNTAIVLHSTGIERLGYHLAGWETTINGAQAVFLLGQAFTVTDDFVFIAYWAADANLVIFDLAGGTGPIEPYIAYTGDAITLPSSGPTKAGYAFRGWYDPSNPNAIYAPGYMMAVSGAIRLIAYWIPTSTSTFTVTYNANGGTGSLSQIVEPGRSVYMPVYGFDAASQVLAGWTEGSTSGNAHDVGEVVQITATTTFYAAWIAAAGSVSVVFDANGGTGSFPIMYVSIGDKITAPAAPTKAGSVFVGWKVIGGAEWDFLAPVEQSMTLQAQWSIHFTISISGLTVTLTMHAPYLGGYTTTILWGDGNQSQGNSVTYTHTYAQAMSGLIDVTSKAGTADEVRSTMPFTVSSDPGPGPGPGPDPDPVPPPGQGINWLLFGLGLFLVILGTIAVAVMLRNMLGGALVFIAGLAILLIVVVF